MIETATSPGQISMLVFHCFFNGSDSITHFDHDFDLELYNNLDHLYGVLIADNSTANKKITAGFALKTTLTHHQPGFLEILSGIDSINEGLAEHIHPKSSFLPFKINVGKTDAPLSENEYLQLMYNQFMRFNVDGKA